MPGKRALPSVLLVGKEDGMRRTIRDFLRGYGVEDIGVHSSAEEAVAELCGNPGKWNVFMLDGSFSDAFEHVMTVRYQLNSAIHILVIIDEPTLNEIAEVIQMGADDFLDVPIDRHALECKLNAIVDKQKRSFAPSPFSVPPN